MSATSATAAVIAQEKHPDAFGSFASVRRLMRDQDDSHLWPVCNRYNVTARAIRRVRDAIGAGLVIDSPLEYYAAIDAEISDMVNSDY